MFKPVENGSTIRLHKAPFPKTNFQRISLTSISLLFEQKKCSSCFSFLLYLKGLKTRIMNFTIQ